MMAAAKARGELEEGIEVETAARLANVLLIAVGDARMMPSLDEYYRLFDPDTSAEDLIAEAVEFICRSVLKDGGRR